MRRSAKFALPPNPLEEEMKNEKLEPPTDYMDDHMIKFAVEYARADPSGAVTDNQLRTTAAAMMISHIKEQKFRSDIGQTFLRGFWQFLLGKQSDALAKKTSWGNQPLYRDPEVRSYLDMFMTKRQHYKVCMQLLKTRVPKGLVQCYLYYKYIVLGKSADDEFPDTLAFLEDWDKFYKAFDMAPETDYHPLDPDNPWVPKPYWKDRVPNQFAVYGRGPNDPNPRTRRRRQPPDGGDDDDSDDDDDGYPGGSRGDIAGKNLEPPPAVKEDKVPVRTPKREELFRRIDALQAQMTALGLSSSSPSESPIEGEPSSFASKTGTPLSPSASSIAKELFPATPSSPKGKEEEGARVASTPELLAAERKLAELLGGETQAEARAAHQAERLEQELATVHGADLKEAIEGSLESVQLTANALDPAMAMYGPAAEPHLIAALRARLPVETIQTQFQWDPSRSEDDIRQKISAMKSDYDLYLEVKGKASKALRQQEALETSPK